MLALSLGNADWRAPGKPRPRSQRRPAALTVTLLLPTPGHSDLICVEGELVPMTDPQPKVLAVALSARALTRLEAALPARSI